MPGSLIDIDIGKLAKPATVLIEKISNAVGLIYEPTHIRRIAQAHADADKTRAAARIEVNALEQRALERLINQSARKQQNAEAIIVEAIQQLPQHAKVDDLSEDWLAHLFRHCEIVSDSQMRTLWAKLLCGEATEPGTYSKRTIDFISTMDKRDAELFTSLGQFVWEFVEPTLLLLDYPMEIYKSKGLEFPTLSYLQTIGLITFESRSSFKLYELSRNFGVRPCLLPMARVKA